MMATRWRAFSCYVALVLAGSWCLAESAEVEPSDVEITVEGEVLGKDITTPSSSSIPTSPTPDDDEQNASQSTGTTTTSPEQIPPSTDQYRGNPAGSYNAGGPSKYAATSPRKADEVATEEDLVELDDFSRSRLALCRRNPTWRKVEQWQEASQIWLVTEDWFEECSNLTHWQPHFTKHYRHWFNGHVNTERDEQLLTCIDTQFAHAVNLMPWARCNESDLDASCVVSPMTPMAKFFNPSERGELAIIENALTQQEEFGLNALASCAKQILPQEMPFYEMRAFVIPEEQGYGMYDFGGNYVTYLTGLMQLYLPGVAASLYQIFRLAYQEMAWGPRLNMVDPSGLGMRNLEYLEYSHAGRLGVHVDAGSIYTVSVALSEPTVFEGGHFKMRSDMALFKIPRRAAIVFLSEMEHGITPVSGERKVFVTEIWAEEDSPVGYPRPTAEDMEEMRRQGSEDGPELENDSNNQQK